ncbi:MAG: hypothetical protein ACK5M5_04775 [Limnobaculum xujianqingii]
MEKTKIVIPNKFKKNIILPVLPLIMVKQRQAEPFLRTGWMLVKVMAVPVLFGLKMGPV